MKKRNLAVLLAFAACVSFVFVACSKKEAATTNEKTTIIYYTWDDAANKVIVDAFNASQDKIFVDARYEPAADYEAKLTTLLTAKAEMDCFAEKRASDMFMHYENGLTEPLDKYIAKNPSAHKAIDNYRTAVTYDGKVLTYPWRGASYYTYYNKKLFEAAGVPTPDTYVKEGTWTWDKFAEVAKQLSNATVYGATVYHWGNNQMLIESQSQKPVISADKKIDFDNNILRWLQMRKSLESEHAMWPLIDMKVSSTHYTVQFASGQVGMLLIGEWFPGHMIAQRDQGSLHGFTWDDWGITRLPCDVTPYVTMGSPTTNEITAYSKKKEAAFEFLTWMGGAGASVVAENGLMPPVFNDEVRKVISKSVPDAQSLDYYLEDKVIYPMFLTKYGSQAEATIVNMTEEYLLGKISDGQFNDELTKRLQTIIDNAY